MKLALDTVLKTYTWKTELRDETLKEVTKKATKFQKDSNSRQKICLPSWLRTASLRITIIGVAIVESIYQRCLKLSYLNPLQLD